MYRNKYKKIGYLIPLLFIGTVNLWNGVEIRYPMTELGVLVCKMFFVGVGEEIIFRGWILDFLWKLCKEKAILMSGILFSLLHILNLMGGKEAWMVLLQVIYAFAIGVLLAVVKVKLETNVPGCIFHGVFNVTSLFGRDMTDLKKQIFVCIITTIVSLAYGRWLWNKKFLENEKKF